MCPGTRWVIPSIKPKRPNAYRSIFQIPTALIRPLVKTRQDRLLDFGPIYVRPIPLYASGTTGLHRSQKWLIAGGVNSNSQRSATMRLIGKVCPRCGKPGSVLYMTKERIVYQCPSEHQYETRFSKVVSLYHNLLLKKTNQIVS
jgi:hypothetical protein